MQAANKTSTTNFNEEIESQYCDDQELKPSIEANPQPSDSIKEGSQ